MSVIEILLRRIACNVEVCIVFAVFANVVPGNEIAAVAAIRPNNNKYETYAFSCNDTALANETIGPSLRHIPIPKNRDESIATLPDREYAILHYFARFPLPLNDSSDEDNNPLFIKTGPTTNPMFNSRADVRQVTNRYISRILLGCYDNRDLDNIILSDLTRPFSLPGSSRGVNGGVCFRDGDYDFSTINLLQLLYVSRQYPGSMPDIVFQAIRDKLLSINGTITTLDVPTQCRIGFGPIHFDLTVTLDPDTENHILQTEISRYLSNQLLLEVYPNNQEYDNNRNGNTKWLLEYLSTFLKDYFYEYNSRPYQALTVRSISVLHSFASDSNIQLVSEMILDMVSAYTSVQMNRLRRYVPFRRQSQYVDSTQSYGGEGELFRMIILVGDYEVFDKQNPSDNLMLSTEFNSVSTIASNYRLKDFILDMFLRHTNEGSSTTGSTVSREYFISRHDTVEMYYTTPNVLISAGGTSAKPILTKLSFQNRFCLFKPCLLKGIIARTLGPVLYNEIAEDERGWARPTTIVPSAEPSIDLLDLIHFDGDRRNTSTGPYTIAYRRNLCVAPNFACGLQLEYGNRIGPIIDQCSTSVGDWRFFDLSGAGKDSSPCPAYGYYMAMYSRSCARSECIAQADTYGLLEISENISNMTIATFQQKVLENNPNPFSSQGIQTYKMVNGNILTLEIHPLDNDQAQILQVQGIDGGGNNQGTTKDFDRNYRNWPLAWSANGSIQSNSMKGRWTFDSVSKKERYIYDITDPLQPKRIESSLPRIRKHSSSTEPVSNHLSLGRYFDDSTNVVANDTIKSISFTSNTLSIAGYRMEWRNSGLQVNHGLNKDRSTLLHRVTPVQLYMNERIVTVGIRHEVYFNVSRVHRIRIVTNENRTFLIGGILPNNINHNENEVIYNADHIIAFYGHFGDAMIHQLRVVSMY